MVFLLITNKTYFQCQILGLFVVELKCLQQQQHHNKFTSMMIKISDHVMRNFQALFVIKLSYSHCWLSWNANNWKVNAVAVLFTNIFVSFLGMNEWMNESAFLMLSCEALNLNKLFVNSSKWNYKCLLRWCCSPYYMQSRKDSTEVNKYIKNHINFVCVRVCVYKNEENLNVSSFFMQKKT